MYAQPEPSTRYMPPGRQFYRPLDWNKPSYRPRSRESYLLDEFENETSCAAFSKYSIFGFNILYMLVGVGLLTLGTWLRIDSRFRDFLSERYRQAVDEAFWQAPTLYIFSYILIVMGAMMMVVAMVGCCGAITGSRIFLGIYGFVVFCLLITTVSCGIYLVYKRDGIDVELSDALNYMVQHYYQGPGIVQESLDRLQQAFRCCGNAGCSDFRAFRQDPPRTCDIRCDGCHYRILLALRIGFSVAVVVFLVVILAQVITVGVSSFLVCLKNDSNRRYETRYWIKHPQQNYNSLPRRVNNQFAPQPAHRMSSYNVNPNNCHGRDRSVPFAITRQSYE